MERAHRTIRLGCACLIAWATSSATYAQTGCEIPVARVVSAQGDVRLDQTTASIDDSVCPGVVIRVGQNSRAAVLVFEQNTVLRIDQNTDYVISADDDEGWVVDLLKGIIHFFSDTPRRLDVKTPFMNAAIEGTEFLVTVENNQSDVLVLEGQVRVSNEQGELLLASGQAASARQGQAPRRRQVVEPFDAVQWALYYPSLGADEQTPDEVREANELLAVGRVNEANEILVRYKDDAVAQALLAMIAVAQNRNDEAEQLATNAVSLDPNSSTAHTALSYVQQAQFDLDAALASAELAVEKDAGNAYAWARLAELQSSFGDLKASLQSAQKAVEADPGISRTQTVLGFAHLTRIEVEEAKIAFNKAINLDPSDALPRLGLGLALIRKNQLKEGREQIQIAASLDPKNSLIRSYLGKAYFEEKDDERAATQLELAKELDPNDPSPYLYDAIRKQAENDPIGALQDLQKSNELNDNRAVYRSSLLIDQDEASRSAGLGRIYNDLGFQQLGILESSKSLAIDPSNHSAHRFLSDVYADRPRHEIARVSELLQAQILQPVNVNPIQPQLSIIDLNIANALVSTDSSFNEFTPLFERNRFIVNAFGVGGNHNTLGDEVVASGLTDKFSFSVGQFHYETDGYRANNELEHDIYNIFGQFASAPDLNFQFELRDRETTSGDLGFEFDRDGFDLERSDDLEDNANRVGVNYGLTSNSQLLFSIIDTKRIRLNTQSPPFPAPFVAQVDRKEEGIQFDGQYIVKHGRINHSFGLLRYNFNVDETISADFSPQSCVLGDNCVLSDLQAVVKQNSVYSYTNVNYPDNFLWTLGASYDSYDDKENGVNVSELNPKFGLRWNPNEGLQLRVAYLKTLKRRLLANQTLEPTNVTGFNQFFDDFNGSSSELTGIGASYSFLGDWTMGIESTRRKQTGRFSFVGGGTSSEEREELTSGIYVLWTANASLAIQGEYFIDSYENDDRELTGQPIDLNSSIFSLGLRYFHSKGYFAELVALRVNQDVTQRPVVLGSNGIPTAGPETKDKDDFVIVNGATGYRFKGRRGFVAIEFNNLFDREFNYQSDNFRSTVTRSPRFVPDATVFLKAQLSF